MMRFTDDDEDDGSDENEIFNDMIAVGKTNDCKDICLRIIMILMSTLMMKR